MACRPQSPTGEREKKFTRLRDQLSQERRQLPRVKVDKEYVFDGPKGKETLSELFDGRSQLIVYHFMFDPRWEAGCPHCSHVADRFNRIIRHLNQRDVTMVAVSQAPFGKLAAYKQRMGWNFKWVSSSETDFNLNYHVSFTPEELAKKKRSTTSLCKIRTARSGRESACFTKTPPEECFTPIQRMRVASICSWWTTTTSTWCQKAEMKESVDPSGCAAMMNTADNLICSFHPYSRGERYQSD